MTEHDELPPNQIQNRVIYKRIQRDDGWTELSLACGHYVHVITGLDTGFDYPCAECINDYVKQARKGLVLPVRCIDPKCNAILMGSLTQHKAECSIGKLIKEFYDKHGHEGKGIEDDS